MYGVVGFNSTLALGSSYLNDLNLWLVLREGRCVAKSFCFHVSSLYYSSLYHSLVNMHAYSCFSTVDLKISPSLHFSSVPCRPEMTLYERIITAQSNGEEKWQWGNVAKTTVWKSISELLTNSGCSYSSGCLYCHPTPGLRAFLGVTPWNPWILSQGSCSHSSECRGWWAQPHICCTIVHPQWNQHQPWGPKGAAHGHPKPDLPQSSEISMVVQNLKQWQLGTRTGFAEGLVFSA